MLNAILYTVYCRYPSTTFLDHVLRYQEDEAVKMIVMLGEVCPALYDYLLSLLMYCILLYNVLYSPARRSVASKSTA